MKHAVYFEGRVQSLELRAEGGRATVGVIEPGAYTFSTSTRERIVLVEGGMRVRLPGADWDAYDKGQELVVGANQSFDIEAAADVAYICFYG
jgi:purine/pyrimidine-nucleoside phosphorylase